MSDLTLTDLVGRLAATEARMTLAHAEIAALRARESRSVIVLLALMLIAASGWSHSTVWAQSAAEPLTVRAPFVVVNKAGRPIMEVNEYGDAQGLLLRNSSGMVVAQAGTNSSGAGLILVRDGTTPDGAAHPQNSGVVALMIKDGSGALQLHGADGAFATIKKDGMKVRGPVSILDSQKTPVVELLNDMKDSGDRGVFLRNSGNHLSGALTTTDEGGGIIEARDGSDNGPDAGAAILRTQKDGSGAMALKASGPHFFAQWQKKQGVRIFGAPKQAVVQMNADDEGRGHVSVLENGVDRASLAVTSKGNAAILLTNAAGQRVAELGSSQDLAGGGSLVIRDANGAPAVTAAAVDRNRGQVTVNSGDRAVASMVVLKSGLGAVQAFNRAGQPVAVLSSGSRGDGLMQLTNAEGQTMVEAGTVEAGVGVVRTGPMGRKAGTAMLGMPGSFLVGRKDW